MPVALKKVLSYLSPEIEKPLCFRIKVIMQIVIHSQTRTFLSLISDGIQKIFIKYFHLFIFFISAP